MNVVQFDNNKRRNSYQSSNKASEEYFIVDLLSKKLAEKIDLYFKAGDVNSELNVLDLGCGSQPFRSKLEALGFNYYSTDVVEIKDTKIDFIVNFSKPLSGNEFGNLKFDYVLCSEVAEHLPEWDVFFKNLNLITKSDSIVLLTSPFIYFLHEVPHDYFRATPFAYEYFASKYSFNVIEIEKAGGYYEVNGTIQNASPEYVTYSKSLLIKLATSVVNVLSRFKHQLKYSSLFQKHFIKHSPYYLSNIVVLKKSASE